MLKQVVFSGPFRGCLAPLNFLLDHITKSSTALGVCIMQFANKFNTASILTPSTRKGEVIVCHILDINFFGFIHNNDIHSHVVQYC